MIDYCSMLLSWSDVILYNRYNSAVFALYISNIQHTQQTQTSLSSLLCQKVLSQPVLYGSQLRVLLPLLLDYLLVLISIEILSQVFPHSGSLGRTCEYVRKASIRFGILTVRVYSQQLIVLLL